MKFQVQGEAMKMAASRYAVRVIATPEGGGKPQQWNGRDQKTPAAAHAERNRLQRFAIEQLGHDGHEIEALDPIDADPTY